MVAASPTPDLRPLYHAPLADFVAARAALAKQLRQAGDPRAAEVRTLRKPSLSAWAVNQLFAGEPQAVAALVDAGQRARRAAETTAQGGDAQTLRDLLRDIRERTERLTQQAVEILATAGGRAPGEAIVERLRGNLDALALDPATAPIAARGWLGEDLEAPGFELLAPLQLAATGPRAAGTPQPAPPATGRARQAAPVAQIDDRRQAIAERKARERRERLERLRAELERAEAEAAELQSLAEDAAAAAEEAARELAAAQERTARAEAHLQDARRRAENAEAVAERAREALATAEDEDTM